MMIEDSLLSYDVMARGRDGVAEFAGQFYSSLHT